MVAKAGMHIDYTGGGEYYDVENLFATHTAWPLIEPLKVEAKNHKIEMGCSMNHSNTSNAFIRSYTAVYATSKCYSSDQHLAILNTMYAECGAV